MKNFQTLFIYGLLIHACFVEYRLFELKEVNEYQSRAIANLVFGYYHILNPGGSSSRVEGGAYQ